MARTCRTFVIGSVLALAAVTAQAAERAPDAVARSTPTTVVRGFISADVPPILHIKSGQTVRIDTVSHGGLSDDPVATFGAAGIPAKEVLQDAIDIAKASQTNHWTGHVLTGPIYVDGAEPGDMLEVRILKVDVRVPYGTNSPGPGGVAPGAVATRTQKVIKFDMARKVALFSDKIEVPLRPFMGIMAVAPGPDIGKISSRPPGPYGGNMDFRLLSAGATLYLPVYNNGALFFTGDSHSVQGDGEVDGNAIEASMTPTLQFIVHKGGGKDMHFPWAEDATNYYVLGMDRDLNLAMRSAVEETIGFLEKTAGLSSSDAYSLCSIGVNFVIAEAVDLNLVVYGTIPKKLFKTPPTYWTKG